MSKERCKWDRWETAKNPATLLGLLVRQPEPRVVAQIVGATLGLFGEDLPPDFRRAAKMFRPWTANPPMDFRLIFDQFQVPSHPAECNPEFDLEVSLHDMARVLRRLWDRGTLTLALQHATSALSYCSRSAVDFSSLPKRQHGDYFHRRLLAAKAIAAEVRHVIRNPFLAPDFGHRWSEFGPPSEETRRLALVAEDGEDPTAFPALHDSLLDAGCVCPEILGHFAVHRRHPWGCWVVDEILDRRTR